MQSSKRLCERFGRTCTLRSELCHLQCLPHCPHGIPASSHLEFLRGRFNDQAADFLLEVGLPASARRGRFNGTKPGLVQKTTLEEVDQLVTGFRALMELIENLLGTLEAPVPFLGAKTTESLFDSPMRHYLTIATQPALLVKGDLFPVGFLNQLQQSIIDGRMFEKNRPHHQHLQQEMLRP